MQVIWTQFVGHFDKHGSFETLTKFASRMLAIMDDLNLCDIWSIWRVLNSILRSYTWLKSLYTGIKQSRLAYFIVLNSKKYQIHAYVIMRSLYSNHSSISIRILNETANTPGHGFWKLNTSLLKDPKYIDLINKVLDAKIIKYNTLADKGLCWDTIISYSSYKAKLKGEYEADLLKEVIYNC